MNLKRLWQFSNQLEIEIFLSSRIQGSGNRKDVILDKYKQDISEVRSKSTINNLFMAFILLLPVFIATSTLSQSRQLLGVAPIEKILLTNSLVFAAYYSFNFIFILLFGMMSISNLLQGDVFKFLHTLPFSKREIQVLGVMTLVRLIFIQLLVMLLALPIGLYIVTQSVTILLSSFLLNSLNLILTLYVLIIIINKLRSLLFTQDKEFGWRSLLRYLVFVIYLISTFAIYFTIGRVSVFLSQLYDIISLPVQLMNQLNLGLAVIPFPFTPSYILTLITLNQIPSTPQILSLTGGGILYILFFKKILQVGNRILLNMAFRGNDTPDTYRDEKHKVQITKRSPLFGYLRITILGILRDVGALMSITLAVLFPLLPLFQSQNTDPMVSFIFYSGFILFFASNAFGATEGTIGSLLTTLPFSHRSMFRGKQTLLSVIFYIGFILLNTLSLGQLLTLEWLILGIMLGILIPYPFLIAKSLLFGKLNNEYTLYTIEDDSSTIRNIMLIVPVVGLAGLNYGLMMYLPLILSPGLELIGFIGINILIWLILELIVRKMFS